MCGAATDPYSWFVRTRFGFNRERGNACPAAAVHAVPVRFHFASRSSRRGTAQSGCGTAGSRRARPEFPRGRSRKRGTGGLALWSYPPRVGHESASTSSSCSAGRPIAGTQTSRCRHGIAISNGFSAAPSYAASRLTRRAVESARIVVHSSAGAGSAAVQRRRTTSYHVAPRGRRCDRALAPRLIGRLAVGGPAADRARQSALTRAPSGSRHSGAAGPVWPRRPRRHSAVA